MNLESAAQCQITIHDYAHEVTGSQLWSSRAANIRLKRNVVYEVPAKLQAIAEDQHAATKDAQLHDFIPEAVCGGDPDVSEIGLGNFHFSGEAVDASGQARLDNEAGTGNDSNDWLETSFEPN